MGHEQFEEALEPYVLGTSDPEEIQAFEAHLQSGCAARQTEVERLGEVVGLLAYTSASSAPPPELKARVMEAVLGPSSAPEVTPLSRGERAPGPSPRVWPWVARPAFAVVLGLVLAGMVTYALFLRSQLSGSHGQLEQMETALQEETARAASLERRIADQERVISDLRAEVSARIDRVGSMQAARSQQDTELAALRTRLAQRERDTARLRSTLARREEVLTFLRSPGVKVISLAGTEEAKSAGAFLLFDPERKAAFLYAFNLPPLPEGKIYQLWAILDKPVSAGIFGTDAGHKSRMLIRRIPDLARITKFAVSVEPAGGRPQPTGAIYLVGQL